MVESKGIKEVERVVQVEGEVDGIVNLSRTSPENEVNSVNLE